jgi:hypothetical protein
MYVYKILYPIIIIIFSILFIYAILKDKENRRFNNKVENFLNKSLTNLKNNALSNLTFTRDFLNGNWTSLTTTVDSNYNVKNTWSININKSIEDVSSNGIYGYININETKYNIKFISNENIIGIIENDESNKNASINIKIINMFNKNDDKFLNNLTYKNNIPKCIISQFIGDLLIYQYIAYKIYNNKVGSELYKIILSGDYYVAQNPPIYDYIAYNKLINNYEYPENYIKIENYDYPNDSSDYNKIINNLKDKYSNTLKFCIQRVFHSPTGADIVTKLSKAINIKMVNSGKLPSKLKIVSFKDDKEKNNLKSFFKPKSTIIYCYIFSNTDENYDYSKKKISIPVPLLKLSDKNNSTNMYSHLGVSFDDVLSVEKVVTKNYTLSYVCTKNSDLENPTFFDLSDLNSIIN